MWQREDMLIGMQSEGRILQYTNDNTPKLIVSTEQCYRVTVKWATKNTLMSLGLPPDVYYLRLWMAWSCP